MRARGDEPEQYTVGEAAELTYLVGRVAWAIQRGGNVAKWDRKISALQARAVAREAAERRVREERIACRRRELAERKKFGR